MESVIIVEKFSKLYKKQYSNVAKFLVPLLVFTYGVNGVTHTANLGQIIPCITPSCKLSRNNYAPYQFP